MRWHGFLWLTEKNNVWWSSKVHQIEKGTSPLLYLKLLYLTCSSVKNRTFSMNEYHFMVCKF